MTILRFLLARINLMKQGVQLPFDNCNEFETTQTTDCIHCLSGHCYGSLLRFIVTVHFARSLYKASIALLAGMSDLQAPASTDTSDFLSQLQLDLLVIVCSHLDVQSVISLNQTSSQMNKTCHSSIFIQQWVHTQSPAFRSSLWSKVVTAAPNLPATQRRREYQYSLLSNPLLLPWIDMAVALVLAIDMNNIWFVDTLSQVVTMTMFAGDAVRMNGSIQAGLPFSICFKASGQPGGLFRVGNSPPTRPITGSPAGIMVHLRGVGAFNHLVTLTLGAPATANGMSDWRFVLGFHGNELMMGVNPHDTWVEMVTDSFFRQHYYAPRCMRLVQQFGGTCVNSRDRSGVPPLITVLRHGPPDFFSWLLDCTGVDINMSSRSGTHKTALWMLAHNPGSHTDAVFQKVASVANISTSTFCDLVLRCTREISDGNVLSRVRTLATRHKLVTLEGLTAALAHMELFVLLLSPPTTGITSEMLGDVLKLACQQQNMHAVRAILSCPVSLSADHITQASTSIRREAHLFLEIADMLDGQR